MVVNRRFKRFVQTDEMRDKNKLIWLVLENCGARLCEMHWQGQCLENCLGPPFPKRENL